MIQRAAKVSEEEMEQLEKNLASSFDFAEYLSILLGQTLGNIVDVCTPILSLGDLFGFLIHMISQADA